MFSPPFGVGMAWRVCVSCNSFEFVCFFFLPIFHLMSVVVVVSVCGCVLQSYTNLYVHEVVLLKFIWICCCCCYFYLFILCVLLRYRYGGGLNGNFFLKTFRVCVCVYSFVSSYFVCTICCIQVWICIFIFCSCCCCSCLFNYKIWPFSVTHNFNEFFFIPRCCCFCCHFGLLIY